MPAVLVAAFTRNRPARVADSDGAPIPEGGRDAYLASLAGSMRRRGMTEREIVAGLTVVNETRCNPPLDSRDVERIAWSVGRYAHDDPVLEKLTTLEAELDRPSGVTDEQAIYEAAGFGWLDVGAAMAEPPPPFDWLWYGLIERREVVWLSGAGKTGKSMLALFLGLHLLAERDNFLGVPLGRLDRVIYLDAENPEKTVKRRLHLAGVPREVADRIRYGILRNADLGSERGQEALELAVRDWPGSLLILDSLIGLHSADEDNAGEVRRFVTGLRRIAEAHDLTIIGLAHEARAGNVRGSTDWGNAVDGTLKVTTDEGSALKWRTLKAVNRRDGADLTGQLTYTFRERTDDNGLKRLDITMPGEVSEAESADLNTHNRRVEVIVNAIRCEPKITLRALALHCGLGHGDRPFERALEAASEQDEKVKDWLVMRRRARKG